MNGNVDGERLRRFCNTELKKVFKFVRFMHRITTSTQPLLVAIEIAFDTFLRAK